jgi:hypothetical protein
MVRQHQQRTGRRRSAHAVDAVEHAARHTSQPADDRRWGHCGIAVKSSSTGAPAGGAYSLSAAIASIREAWRAGR